MPRSPIKDFQLGNRAYVNASVSFYTVAGGERTATLATLYAAETGTETLGNPVKLDGYGKFKRIPYIDVQVIGVVNGLGIPSHETGVISPAPTFRVNSSTSALEYSYDGGVSWNDSNGDIFKPRGAWAGPGTAYNLLDLVTNGGIVYVCVTPHSSAAAFATDLAASRWVTLVSFTAAAIANVPAGGISATNVQDALNELDTEKAPKASPVFTGNPTAPTPSPGDNDTSIATTAFVVAAITALAAGPGAGLVDYWHVDADTGHRDMIAAGWMPAFFNQQWGGAPHYFELVDQATGTPYKFEAATGFINETHPASGWAIADNAARTWESQGFKVSQTGSYSAIWVKIIKIGNPTGNLEMRVLPDDGTGKPSGGTAIVNGTATAISGKLFPSGTWGNWMRFAFSSPMSLTAGTQYHITLKSSAAVSGTDYWTWATTRSGDGNTYPHGQPCNGDGVPAWTAQSTYDNLFLVEAPSSLQSIQSGGIFSDGKISFFEGTPLNQSNARVKNLSDFNGLDLTDCTILVRGSAWTKDKTILDLMYGMDHDRIVLRSAITTGFPTLTVYEQDGSVHTVTGTTDVSSGNHDIGIRIRAKNDGSDEIALWVDGASQGTPIAAANISFDALFGHAHIGTAWVGGGFALAPSWTKDTAMGSLPSADGWTYNGTGSESSCMTISGGKMFQVFGGYASTDTGYYNKSGISLSNANGWGVLTKLRFGYSTANKNTLSTSIQLADGSKSWSMNMKDYYLEASTGAFSLTDPAYHQINMKSAENVILAIGKGSDWMLFANGRIAADGSSRHTTASASNFISFGDGDAAAGENADVTWDYLKYHNVAWLPPQCTAGSLSEIAFWNGDKTSLLNSLYNSGSFASVKSFCGLSKNFVGDAVVQRYTMQGIVSGPTSSAASLWLLQPDIHAFAIGGEYSIQSSTNISNSGGAATLYTTLFVDGEQQDRSFRGIAIPAANSNCHAITQGDGKLPYFGLHKIEPRWNDAGSTNAFLPGNYRRAELEVWA